MNERTRKLFLRLGGFLSRHTQHYGDEADALLKEMSDVLNADEPNGTRPMQFGVYRKLEGRTGVGMLYQFLLLARHHTTGDHAVIYIPLRIDPAWAGTIRPCWLERADFADKFEYVGEGLPDPVDAQ